MGHAFNLGHVRTFCEADPCTHFGAMRRNAFDQRRKGDVKQNHFVFGMVDDVNELLRVQTWIARVHHHAAARDCVISFKVAVIVPSNGPHHTAFF